jgi:toxin ParE1/3/4
MAQYKLSPAATQDLENIWQYTEQQWGAAQAEFYVDTLLTAFTRLADSPLAAPSCEHIRAGYRRSHVERHMIYFRAVDLGIIVIRILHDRMDAARHI